MIEPLLISYLLADSAIASRVSSGSPSVGRIYPERIAQNAVLPAIAYYPLGGPIPELLDGNPDLVFATYQLTCCAATAKAASELASVVMSRMIGEGGDGFQKAGVWDQGSTDEEEPDRYNRIIDVRIAYAESSP